MHSQVELFQVSSAGEGESEGKMRLQEKGPHDHDSTKTKPTMATQWARACLSDFRANLRELLATTSRYLQEESRLFAAKHTVECPDKGRPVRQMSTLGEE